MNQTSLAPDRRLDLALAVLRLVAGVIFIAHGGQKLFSFGLPGVTTAFAGMGIPLAAVTAPLVAILEFAGGLALLAGLLTRLAALGLAIEMLGAIALVHLKGGFFLPNGFEFALAMLGSSAALALAGAGAFSLDHLLAARRARDAGASGRGGSRRAAA
ncbi:MAG TPA: DoxX family protein [Gemmatimonadaceae bacterium]